MTRGRAKPSAAAGARGRGGRLQHRAPREIEISGAQRLGRARPNVGPLSSPHLVLLICKIKGGGRDLFS
jgi:hypothetical protein